MGVTYAQLAADPTKALIAYENAGKNLSLDSNWSSFLKLGAGEKTQNIVYGIFAAGDMSGTKYQGTFTSGTQTVAPPVEANTTPPGSVTITWKGQIDAINLHEAEIAANVRNLKYVVFCGTDKPSLKNCVSGSCN